MKLQEIMVTRVIQISPDETIDAAAKCMREQSVGCLVATVDGAVKGIITDRDLLACLELNHNPYGCAVAAHLSRPAIVLRPGEEHTTAVRVMRERRIKRLVIAQNGKLLGIVSLSDLAAVAHAEAAQMGASCEFILDVVGAQVGQGKVNSAAAPARPAAEFKACPEHRRGVRGVESNVEP